MVGILKRRKYLQNQKSGLTFLEKTNFKNFVRRVGDVIFAEGTLKIDKNACMKKVRGWNERLTRVNVVNLRDTHFLTKNSFSRKTSVFL